MIIKSESSASGWAFETGEPIVFGKTIGWTIYDRKGIIVSYSKAKNMFKINLFSEKKQGLTKINNYYRQSELNPC